jgi:hypothetical protein
VALPAQIMVIWCDRRRPISSLKSENRSMA